VRALTGIRVLDLSQMWAGPTTAMYLADHGAEVIKVEPLAGDDSRRTFTQPPIPGNESRAFLAINRNKRGIALDIRQPRGREIVHRIVQDVDVVLHNFRPGVAERLGYDYPTLRDLNERLVYAWLTAFGSSGPYADRPGYDRLFQGLSGIFARTRLPDGTPLGAGGLWVADSSAPMEFAYGIALALFMRERTGQGQLVTTSLLHATLAMQLVDLVSVERELESPGSPSDYAGQAMFSPYRCQDGAYLVIVVIQDAQWQRLCHALEIPEAAREERFATALSRAQHSSELFSLLGAIFAKQPRDAWFARLESHDVPCAPILEPDEVLHHPQIVGNEMLVEAAHPLAGRTLMVSQPVRLHASEPMTTCRAPLLGEHTEQVLREWGYDEAAIRMFEAEGVVRCLSAAPGAA
jgi:crotonobetainyl-CoA:carnitine CoA-transferase CaiB-like acyl-CoA transferase